MESLERKYIRGNLICDKGGLESLLSDGDRKMNSLYEEKNPDFYLKLC